MIGNYELGQLVAQTQQHLRRILSDAEALVVELTHVQRILAGSTSSCMRAPTAPVSDPRTRIVIANGRRLADEETRALDRNDHDVVFDLTSRTLVYRERPETHSEPRFSELRGIGSHRIKIFAFMIERFGIPICADDVDDLLSESEGVATPQAFTKSISMLRQALGGKGGRNPYIQSVPAWESSRRINARAYRLNPKWQYLLIKQGKIQKSWAGHDAVREESGA